MSVLEPKTEQSPRQTSTGSDESRKSRAGAVWSLVRDAAVAWYGHDAFRHGAALAFYTVVSLAPLVLVTVSVVGLAFGPEGARQRLLAQVEDLVGADGAEAVRLVIEHAQSQSAGILNTAFGLVAFVLGYVAVFFELEAGLDAMLGSGPDPNRSTWAAVKKMLFSFALLAVFGFLLLVSLVTSAVLAAVHDVLMQWQPNLVLIWQAANFFLTLVIAVCLFALILKYIPDTPLRWRDVWVGAGLTALLFLVGKTLVGIYLGRSGVASSYGAAGSLIVLLLWLYYSAVIVFYGAELTRLYASRYGKL